MGIVKVPLAHFLQHLFVAFRRSPLLQFPEAAHGPLLHGGRQEDLHRGIRQDHGSDVPAVHHHVVLPGQLPLHFQQMGPHRRMGGDRRGVQGDLRQTDLIRHIRTVQCHVLQAVLSVMQADLQFRQQRGSGLTILGVHALGKGGVADGAVNGAGIHI